MGKQSWKAGNMLNPVPAVMVSVADQNHRPNIITNRLHQSADGFHFRPPIPLFL